MSGILFFIFASCEPLKTCWATLIPQLIWYQSHWRSWPGEYIKFLLPVKESPNSCSSLRALSYVLRAWSSVIRLFISRMLSMDLGFKKTATGCSWAICKRLMALPLTSRIQCLPCVWEKDKLSASIERRDNLKDTHQWFNGFILSNHHKNCIITNMIHNIWMSRCWISPILVMLWGYCTPDLKLPCFVCYLEIINTFWKIIYVTSRKLSKELNNDTEILVGKAFFFWLWIKQSKYQFDQ